MADLHMTSIDCVIGLFGAGGFGREILPLVKKFSVEKQRSDPAKTWKIYVVEQRPSTTKLNDVDAISDYDFFNIKCSEKYYNIAIGNSQARERISQECEMGGAKPISFFANSCLVDENTFVGDGALFCAFTISTSNAKIGKFFHANIYSYIAHDCIIGDFVTFAPNVSCNGNVHIENHAYIGTGAILKNGTSDKPLRIGAGAIVGMGAVITKDVPAHTTVIGNPARALEK